MFRINYFYSCFFINICKWETQFLKNRICTHPQMPDVLSLALFIDVLSRSENKRHCYLNNLVMLGITSCALVILQARSQVPLKLLLYSRWYISAHLSIKTMPYAEFSMKATYAIKCMNFKWWIYHNFIIKWHGQNLP